MFNFQPLILSWMPRIVYGSGLTLADRLASQASCTICVLFGILSILDHYITSLNPIECRCGSSAPRCEISFINTACWVQNEFYQLKPEDHSQGNSSTRFFKGDLKLRTAYYQWIGLLLIGLGILGYVPRALWLRISSRSGFSEDLFLVEAKKLQEERDPEYFERDLRILAKNLDKFFRSREYRPIRRLGKCAKLITCFTFKFIFTKVVYLCIMGCQIGLLFQFGGTDFNLLGNVVNKDDQYPHTGLPTMLLCKLPLQSNSNQETTYLCAVPGNLLNQLLLAILIYWLVIVAVICFISFLLWTVRCAWRKGRDRFVIASLRCFNIPETLVDRERLVKFVRNYMQSDGVLVIRLIEYYSDAFTANLILRTLYEQYQEESMLRLKPMLDELDGADI